MDTDDISISNRCEMQIKYFERLRKSAKKQADLRAGKVVYVDVKETAEPNDG